MTDNRLSEIETRVVALPSDSWTVALDHEERDHAHVLDSEGKKGCRVEAEREDYDGSEAAVTDAERRCTAIPAFIAHARQDVPDLVAEVRKAAALLVWFVRETALVNGCCASCHKPYGAPHADGCVWRQSRAYLEELGLLLPYEQAVLAWNP